MNAIPLFVRKFGDSKMPALIILHGLFGMSDNWVTLAKAFSQKYYVLVPDLRNHGLSPHTEEFSYELMINDIEFLLQNESVNEAYFLGHSMGGKLAMNFCASHPHLVKKMIIADMSLKQGEFKEIHATILETIARTDLSKFNSYSDLEKWFGSFIEKKKIVLFALKNVYKRPNGDFEWKLNYFSIYQNTHKIMEAVTLFDPIQIPALFIKGELSDYILEEDIDEIITWFPQSEIKTISGASHWVHADNPQLFKEIVSTFLEK